MKKIAAILCLSVMTTGAFAQGLINFLNNGSSLVSAGSTQSSTAINGPAGSYYFGLLTSPVGSNTFTFSGVYATNQTVAGRIFGGAGVQVAGWAAGTSRDFKVAGWIASLGPTFQNSWLAQPPSGFGLSSLGTGAAGGGTSTGTLPNLNIFGGSTGIQNGFLISTVPEPTSFALAGLGAALLVLRRRK